MSVISEKLIPEFEMLIVCIVTVLSVVGVVGNITVLIVSRSSERRIGRKVPSNVFIRNLALTDMLIGLLILPIMVVSVSSQRVWKLTLPGCQIHGVWISVLINVSILSLTGIAIDRYLAVVQPIYYKVILTRRRARALVVLFWILSLIIALLPFASGRTYEYEISACLCLAETAQRSAGNIYLLVSTFFTIIIPFIILCYCYIRIYTEFKVRSVQRQIYNRAKRLSIQVLEWGQAHMALHQASGRAEKGGNVQFPASHKDLVLHTVIEETMSVSSHVSIAANVTTRNVCMNNSQLPNNTILSNNNASFHSNDSMSRLNSVKVKRDEVVNDLKTAMKKMFSKKARARGTPKCMRNASVTARLIIVCFLLCWTPYIVKIIYTLVRSSSKDNEQTWYLYTHILIVITALSNCAWNPLIYISRSATYKKEIAKMLFFRLKNKATPKTDSNYNIPVPVQRIQRKLSIIAGIEPIPSPIRSRGSYIDNDGKDEIQLTCGSTLN